MSIFQKLFGFTGRIRRSDWWLFSILLAVVEVVIRIAVRAATGTLAEGANPTSTSGVVADGLVSLVFFWPSLALSVKRLHDRRKSGWLMFLPIILGFALGCYAVAGVSPTASPPLPFIIIVILVGVVGLWLFVELGILDGAPGPNKYGPSPKAPG